MVTPESRERAAGAKQTHATQAMLAAFFGLSEPEPEPEVDEKARKKEARRKKAAIEARKIREATQGQGAASSTSGTSGGGGGGGGAGAGGEEITGFAVGTSARKSKKESPRPSPPSAKPPSMGSISEETLRGIETAKRAVASMPVQLSSDGLDKNVADMMAQVRLQHEEDMHTSLIDARRNARLEVQEELEEKHAESLRQKDDECAKAVEAGKKVLEDRVEQLERKVRDMEAAHAKALEEAAEGAQRDRTAAIDEVAQRLTKETQETRLASAHLLRRAETDLDAKKRAELTALTEQMASEKEAAVQQARAEAKIEMTAVMAEAVAKAEAEARVKFEAEQQVVKAKMAEKLAGLNRSFKSLLTQLIEQPAKLAAKGPNAPLMIME